MEFTREDGYEVLRRELITVKVLLVEFYESEEPEYAKAYPAPENTVVIVIAQRVSSIKVPPVFLTGKNAGSCEIKSLLASADPGCIELETKPPKVSGIEDRPRSRAVQESRGGDEPVS